MLINPRQAIGGLAILGAAGALMFLPAVAWLGNMLTPSQPVPATSHVAPLVGDAIWARANGGRAAELASFDPFTIGRTAGCHLLAERFEDQADRDRQHDECMKLMPGIAAVGYLSTVHLRSQGVWQDARVPFVQIATMSRMTGRWTKAELIDTLALRGEFPASFIGVESAARGFFGRSAADVTVAQAATLAAFLGDARANPWCEPAAAGTRRRVILEKMRENGAIDDATLAGASASPLGLGPPAANHKPCRD